MRVCNMKNVDMNTAGKEENSLSASAMFEPKWMRAAWAPNSSYDYVRLCHAICTLVMKAVGHLPMSPRRRPNQFPRCRRSLQIVNAGMNTLMAKYFAIAVEPNAATAASRRPRSRSHQCQRLATPMLCRGHARVFVLTRATKIVAKLSHLLCGKLTALKWA